jgi:hypothetical protein
VIPTPSEILSMSEWDDGHPAYDHFHFAYVFRGVVGVGERRTNNLVGASETPPGGLSFDILCDS